METKDIILNKPEIATFEFQGETITVTPILSSKQIIDIIIFSVDSAITEDGIVQKALLDMTCALGIVFNCTNLILSEEDSLEFGPVYDKLNRSGFIESTLACIDKDDLTSLTEYVCAFAQEKKEYNTSILRLLDSLPDKIRLAAESVRGLEAEGKLTNVIELAKTLGYQDKSK